MAFAKKFDLWSLDPQQNGIQCAVCDADPSVRVKGYFVCSRHEAEARRQAGV